MNSNILSVIMAGGRGTRLYPLTASTPKPLLPMCDVPLILKIIKDIKTAGIDRIKVTLGYLGKTLEESLKDGSVDISGVSFVYEETPLGTAGAVKNALENEKYSYVLIVSGDALFEGDYSKLISDFKEKKADALIASVKVPDPERFGVIVEKNGVIMRFVEKPPKGTSPSDLVSTGIYVLSKNTVDMIPDGVYDFGKELFPKMLSERKKIVTSEIHDYWCDIGTPESYYACNMRISKNNNVIGKCRIEDDSNIKSSILFDGAQVGKGCRLNSCIIGKNTHIADNVSIGEGAVIGEGSKISADVPANTTVMPGSVI